MNVLRSAALAGRLASRLGERLTAPGASLVAAFAGAAGLGKTHTAILSAAAFGPDTAVHVKLDGYLRAREERRRLGVNGYQLEGWRLAEALASLQAFIVDGDSLATMSYTPEGRVVPGPILLRRPLVILDGNLTILAPPLRDLCQCLVFFDASLRTMRLMRIQRDVVIERRFTRADAHQVWRAELEALRHNVLPARATADLVVRVMGPDRYSLQPRLPREEWDRCRNTKP